MRVRIGELASGAGFFLAMTVLIAWATVALTELRGRQQFLSIIDQLIREKEALVAAAPSRVIGADSLGAGQLEASRNAQAEILRYRDFRSATLLLTASGGSATDENVKSLRTLLLSPPSDDSAIAQAENLNFSIVYRWVSLLPNDALMVLLMAFCGAIGTAVAAIRSGQGLNAGVMALGMATGFITFLVVSGGKEVFLIQPVGSETTFNPYSSALFALLAGLFTERAYKLLSSIIEQFSNRLEHAFEMGQQARERTGGRQRGAKQAADRSGAPRA